MDNFAAPHSAPVGAAGTIFGYPVSMLRDASLQRKVLFFAGIALIASIVVPLSLSPLVLPIQHIGWDRDLAGRRRCGVPHRRRGAAEPAPANSTARDAMDTVRRVLRRDSDDGRLGGGGAGFALGGIHILAYATLVLRSARAHREAGGSNRAHHHRGRRGPDGPALLSALSFAFSFGSEYGLLAGASGLGKIIKFVYQLLWFAIIVLGSACILFVVPPQKLPPALRAVDNFGPIIAAALLLWLVVGPILFLLALALSEPAHILDFVLIFAHMLLPVLAYFGILMMTAPGAYEEAKRMFAKNKAGGDAPPPAQQGGGYPPQGGGYPPQGGGYPPQGGGYPPQGGGYPPR